MIPLQVTGYLASAIAVSDNWSPSLDALLEYIWLDQKGLLSPHPQPDQIIQADIPLKKDVLQGESFWASSSPFYLPETEQITRYRKRWDYQDRHCDWGKKKAKVDTQQGVTKSWDLPLKLINPPRIDWFCVGELEGVRSLLSNCHNLGKKRSQGKGQVYRWEVTGFEEDWSLWRNGQLTRPVPLRLVGALDGYSLMRWGWRSPSWLLENQEVCLMPNNISFLLDSTYSFGIY